MRNLLSKLCAASLTCAMLAPGAEAISKHGRKPIVDVFPVQSWAQLRQADKPLPDPAGSPASTADEGPHTQQGSALPPAVPPRPFELVGEWREKDVRVYVLDGAGGTFIVCDSACAVRDAIYPGQEIAGGYTLKRLSTEGLEVLASDGRIYDLPFLEFDS